MKTIHTLKITNYKSIDSLELKGLTPFSVFAGPNGSGKSNFFDALDFVSLFVLRGGIEEALRKHGGFANIHSEKCGAEHSGEFGFEIECDLPEIRQADKERLFRFHYSLRIRDFDQNPPTIEEHVLTNGALLLTRKKDDVRIIQAGEEKDLGGFSKTHSALLFLLEMPLAQLLTNTGLCRIDPIGAKTPDRSDSYPNRLDTRGHNLAGVLNRLEHDKRVRETIMEWMETVVPGIEGIQTQQQQLDR